MQTKQIDLATILAMLTGQATKTEELEEAIVDVRSAIDALPSTESIVALARNDSTSLRFKLHIAGGHLEADVPQQMLEAVAVGMRASLTAREVELKAELEQELTRVAAAEAEAETKQ